VATYEQRGSSPLIECHVARKHVLACGASFLNPRHHNSSNDMLPCGNPLKINTPYQVKFKLWNLNSLITPNIIYGPQDPTLTLHSPKNIRPKSILLDPNTRSKLF